jgi:hypothetical protein
VTPEQFAATYERLRGEPAWRLLAADSAPEVLGLLQHLLFESERTLPASVLHERLTTELEVLRARGREMSGTATYYIRQWLGQGWLERRLPEDEQEEQYELSSPALLALRLAGNLHTTREAATESRLALVMDQLAQLAHQTDADRESRLAQLLEERAQIDAKIDAVTAGRIDVLPAERAAERLVEIVGLARELSEDFRRVRDRFTDLNRIFRERIVQDEGQRGAVLADLFAGVDVIAESPAGRTFSAFWNLLTDPEQSAQLEASIDALSAREFASLLPAKERQFLNRLTYTLLKRAGNVNNTQTSFARSLRSFVQTREYQEQRRLMKLIRSAKAAALELRTHVRPEDASGQEIWLSTATYRSVGQLHLDEPAQPLSLTSLTEAEASGEDLARIAANVLLSEIDTRTLKANIAQILEIHSQCSIAELMEHVEPAQGLGTVVGYLSLGHKHGVISPKQTEHVAWTTAKGSARSARIPLVTFTAERRHELLR